LILSSANRIFKVFNDTNSGAPLNMYRQFENIWNDECKINSMLFSFGVIEG